MRVDVQIVSKFCTTNLRNVPFILFKAEWLLWQQKNYFILLSSAFTSAETSLLRVSLI